MAGRDLGCVRCYVAAVLLVLALNLVSSEATSWTYKAQDINGPDNWYLNYPDCGGQMQSPIDIVEAVSLYDPHQQLFDFSDYSTTDGVVMTLENVGGHTAEVIFSGKDLLLKGGSLPDAYKLVQFHFHWGHNGTRGSEHSFNGQFFPMEVHLVHHQQHLPNVSVAASHPFGLAVAAFTFKVGNHNNNYDKLLQYLDKIQNPDDTLEIPTFPVISLLPETARYDYYRYHGSLTTPPCYESVIWSFFSDQVEISQDQLDKFYTLLDEEHHQLVDDFRPIQNLNDRTIYTTKISSR